MKTITLNNDEASLLRFCLKGAINSNSLNKSAEETAKILLLALDKKFE